MKRRKFTAEFKRKVVVEAMRGDRTVREIAARHGLNPNQVGRWKSEAMDGLPGCSAGAGWRSRTGRRRS